MRTMMSASEIAGLLEVYQSTIMKGFPKAKPARKSEGASLLEADINHLLWMIGEVRGTLEPSKAVRGQLIRAARWMGFIEGSMVQLRLITQEEIQMMDVKRLLQQGADA